MKLDPGNKNDLSKIQKHNCDYSVWWGSKL